MPTINIEVKNKIAKSPLEHIVCGNSDYFIKFIFDSEWEEYRTKTARFEWGGQHYDQIFDGDICNIPVISGANVCAVGVFAGNLHTTTPALVTCDKSILCNDSTPADPLPDVYDQILKKLNEIYDKTGGASVSTDVSLGLKKATVGDIIKVKTVDENGVPTEWKTADLPGAPVLYVNLTMGGDGTITADKTFAEITEAAGSGMCVIAQAPGTVLYLSSYNGTSAGFSQNNGVQTVRVYCDSSDTWSFESHTLNSRDVGAIPSPSTAAVGQAIVVKAVDGNGVPTEWGAADMPSDEHINGLIDAKLGVIENGTY